MLETVKGQDEGIQYLAKVVQGTFTSPLLLIGDEGVGKRFSVIESAKEAFKEEDPSTCSQCYKISQGIHPDLRIVYPEEGKDIKVGAIRDLLGTTGFYPSIAPYKYLVIDGADRMTSAAADALLKTLEEAPSSVRFFLLAEREEQVIPTIRSRCVMVRYRRLPEDFVVSALSQHTDDYAKALVYTRIAGGSLGRAVEYLGSGRLALRNQMLTILKMGPSKDLATLFPLVDNVKSDLPQGLRFLEQIVFDLVMLPHDPTRIINLDVFQDLKVLRGQLGSDRLTKLRHGLKTVLRRSKGNINLAFHVKSMMASVFA